MVCTRREWYQFDPLWAKLAACHMSEDETDADVDGKKSHPPRWWIVESLWPSRKLRRYFRKLDKHYRADYSNPIRYGKRGKSGGNPPRERVKCKTNPKVKLGEVPVGLWRNCYSKAFLKTLKPGDLKRMRIIDEDFDFKLPEEPPKEVGDDCSDSSDEEEVVEMMDAL